MLESISGRRNTQDKTEGRGSIVSWYEDCIRYVLNRYNLSTLGRYKNIIVSPQVTSNKNIHYPPHSYLANLNHENYGVYTTIFSPLL